MGRTDGKEEIERRWARMYGRAKFQEIYERYEVMNQPQSATIREFPAPGEDTGKNEDGMELMCGRLLSRLEMGQTGRLGFCAYF
jgi:hypothetical protein